MTEPDPRYCNGKKKQGPGLCTRPAGWGTDHAGQGRCKLHGGSTKTHRKAAQTERAREMVETMGLPREIDPHDALLEEVYRTAGHVVWLAEVVRGLEERNLTGGITKTIQLPDGTRRIEAEAAINVWVKLYQEERGHLLRACRTAVEAGVAERAVKIAEDKAQLIAEFGRGLLAEFNIDPASDEARTAFRKHLTLVQGGKAEAA